MAANQPEEILITLEDTIRELESLGTIEDNEIPTITPKKAVVDPKRGVTSINFNSPLILNTSIIRAQSRNHVDFGRSYQYYCQSVRNSLLKVLKSIEKHLGQKTMGGRLLTQLPFKFFVEQGSGAFYLFSSPELGIKPQIVRSKGVTDHDINVKHSPETYIDKMGGSNCLLRKGPYEGVWRVVGVKISTKLLGESTTCILSLSIYPSYFIVNPCESLEVIDTNGEKIEVNYFVPDGDDVPQSNAPVETSIKNSLDQQTQNYQHQFDKPQGPPQSQPAARYANNLSDGFDQPNMASRGRQSFRPRY